MQFPNAISADQGYLVTHEQHYSNLRREVAYLVQWATAKVADEFPGTNPLALLDMGQADGDTRADWTAAYGIQKGRTSTAMTSTSPTTRPVPTTWDAQSVTTTDTTARERGLPPRCRANGLLHGDADALSLRSSHRRGH